MNLLTSLQRHALQTAYVMLNRCMYQYNYIVGRDVVYSEILIPTLRYRLLPPSLRQRNESREKKLERLYGGEVRRVLGFAERLFLISVPIFPARPAF
jgi:hypothetical protein